jgi:hypothetical protein
MPTFHRNSANPAGYDPFPSGYDFINDPALNSPPGLGTPAIFDVKKSGGPNDGVYFFAFGDDNTTNNINRPVNALADNCDTLDNYLRKPIAVPTRIADVFTGSPVSSITLPGPPSPPSVLAVYLGTTGQDSFTESLQTLFDVLDNNDDEIIDPATGIRTIVTSITSTNVGDVVGSGFAVGTITLHLNQPIPGGHFYRVYYGEKSSLAGLPPDALTIIKVRGAMEVPALVEDIIKQITNPGTVPEVVTALVASHFATPSNGRLPASTTMFFDLDPIGLSSVIRSFEWTTQINTVSARTVLRIDSAVLFPSLSPLTGQAEVDSGIAWASAGTYYMTDANLQGTPVTNLVPVLPLSSAVIADGDYVLRVLEKPPVLGTLGFGSSLIKASNARWSCTIGDGVRSFGDFNGASALDDVLTFLNTNAIRTAYIQIKRGAYNLGLSHVLTMDSLTLEGHGSLDVDIQLQTVSGPGIDFSANSIPSLLRISGVTFGFTSGGGTHSVVVTEQNVALYMKDVGFDGTTLTMLNPTIFGNVAALYADRCAFTQIAAGSISVDLQVGILAGTATPEGFFFDQCSFNQADETQPMRIRCINSPSVVSTVSRVRFRDCKYLLGGTATSGSQLTHNTGVIEIDPNGTTNKLTVSDLTWENCSVQSFTAAANGPVARIYGLSIGAGGVTHRALVESVTISGGAWSAANFSSTGTAISPVLIAAQIVILKDVAFIGNLVQGGGPQPDDQYVVDNTVHTASDWAQFIFAPGSFLVQQQTLQGDDVHLTMRDVTFRFLPQSGTSGDAWFFMGDLFDSNNVVDVRGVQFCDYKPVGTGTRPSARVRVTAGCTMGAFRDISIFGGNSTGNSNSWTTHASGTAGIFVVSPTVGQVSQQVTFDNICIDGFFYQGGVQKDDGIVIVNPSSGLCTWFYTFLNCHVRGLHQGLFYGISGNSNPLDNFHVVGGEFNYNDFGGIQIDPDIMGRVEVRGVTCIGNSVLSPSYDILINPTTWQNSGQQSITIVDNYCRGTGISISSTNCNIGLLSNTSGDHVKGFCHGNTCINGSGGSGGIHVEDGAGGALTSPAQLGNQIFIEGVETGIGGSPNLTYTTAQLMMRNLAALITP